VLTGFTFWTDDKIWRGILTELGATAAARDNADIVIGHKAKGIGHKISVSELHAAAIAGRDAKDARVLESVCGAAASDLSDAQKKLVLALADVRARGNAPSPTQDFLTRTLVRKSIPPPTMRGQENTGLTAGELRAALGYAADADTHAADTIIYQLRKKFGAGFIVYEGGMYKLGDKIKN